jgi:hypothetical protein
MCEGLNSIAHQHDNYMKKTVCFAIALTLLSLKHYGDVDLEEEHAYLDNFARELQ